MTRLRGVLMSLLLPIGSGVALALLVVHSWRTRGRAVTLGFFSAALLFGILRGNAVWFIMSTFEGSSNALKPYLPQEGLLPEIGHDSLQVALGWVFALYLAWTVAELVLRRLPRFAGRVFMIAGLASLFMFGIAWCMETTAVTTGWWYWSLPTHTALFGDVNTPGMCAWFSVVPTFLMPFLVIVCAATGNGGARLKWLWTLVFPVYLLAHLAYGTVPHASLIYPALILLVVGLMFTSRLRMGPGEIGPASRLVAALPAFALVIFFGVLVAGNVVCGGGPENLMTLVPLLLLCLLAWRRVPVWAVAALSLLALGGWVWVGPRALYALAPAAAYGLLVLFERRGEPLRLKLVAPAVVVALTVWSVVNEELDTARAVRYVELWKEADRAVLANDAERAGRLYAESDGFRSSDTLVQYRVVRNMTLMSPQDPARAVQLFELRLPRVISEMEEVTRRDRKWLTPREDLARLHVLRGELPQAVAQYREMLRAQPANSAVMSMLGYLLLRTGEAEEAEHVLEQVLRLRKPPAEAMINLGVIRFRQRRDAEARKLWEEARGCRPAHPAAGWNLERLKDPTDDRRIDTIYLACAPTSAVAPWFNDLAAYSQTMPARDKVRLLVEATQFDPLLVRAHLNLARVYLTTEGSLYDAKRALRHARRAEEGARSSKNSAELAESRLVLHDALLANGKSEEAKRVLEEGKGPDGR
jgi:tetratricopeptide (TPR) repeat protein